MKRAVFGLIGAILITVSAAAQDTLADVAKLKRRPQDFAIIFQMGYGSDTLPQDDENYEKLVKACNQANYNVVLGKYSPRRESICKDHNMKMMIDLLVSDHHIYKNLDGARTLCKSVRNSDNIYGYHLWSDSFGGRLEGRNRDIANVHRWDPHHATYAGDRNAREIAGLKEADLIGYYDFHWKRLGHFRHLFRALAAAGKTESRFLRYIDGAPGRIGKGNYNRVLYTVTTSIAFGMKGYMFHYTGECIDTNTWQWKELGEDLRRANAEIAPLGPELMKIGLPSAVYSTPITRNAKDRPIDSEQATVPPEFEPIPHDFGIQVVAGEAIMGVFPENDQRAHLFFANHNAYQTQSMKLKLDRAASRVRRFDRQKKKWIKMNPTAGMVSFEIGPANGELVQVDW